MALYPGKGLCAERCDIDDYAEGAQRIEQVADRKEADGQSEEAERTREIAKYQRSIVDESVESASVTPCPGLTESNDHGVTNIGMVDLGTMCPVVRRLINVATIITPEGA
jgi:hypothetical protein